MCLKSDIRVKNYDHLTCSRASVVQFRASRYIIGLERTSESNVVVVWICLVLPCFISSISIYYALESDSWAKGFDHLNISRSSIVLFWVSQFIIGLYRTSESKVTVVWICLLIQCLISSFTIYYAPELASECKVMTIWISQKLPLFNFERLNILLAKIGHPTQKLWPF